MNSLVEHSDFVSIDDQLATLSLDLTMETSVGGVILEHVDLWNKGRTLKPVSGGTVNTSS